MWRAFSGRDASYVGVFHVCVKTTGIYCKITCPARLPKRENVEFVATPVDAERLGYRPCKRCRPSSIDDEPEWVKRLEGELRRDPMRRLRDEDLRRLEIEPARARRWYQARHGVSFHGYQRAMRLGRAMTALRDGESISSVAFDAGFESESGFREAWSKLFGDPPTRATRRGHLVAERISTPLGAMLAIAATGEDAPRGIVMCEFLDRRALETELDEIRKHYRTSIVPGSHELLDQLRSELEQYHAGTRQQFDVPLAPVATPFEAEVWTELQAIPYAETRSYADLARAIGKAGASRAVGRANGRNRIAILIPCHRVIGSDGKLTGYGGGLWRKQRLLELERNGR
ncbi:MAG: bifunctional transcriptional activator/DNA repair protein Ada [Planctomycetes bacterium]|nr:bifunctional transcriptional activator/DNA repair protein Ada [Planctomycetota bacterium]MCB9920251.1 bifunctional transcriptional activator/DNA repair protein Ada [Planctomycetota bacterium]